MEPDDPNLLAVASNTTDTILRRVVNEREMHTLRDIIDTEIAALLTRIAEKQGWQYWPTRGRSTDFEPTEEKDGPQSSAC
jgi:hypothetical protein